MAFPQTVKQTKRGDWNQNSRRRYSIEGGANVADIGWRPIINLPLCKRRTRVRLFMQIFSTQCQAHRPTWRNCCPPWSEWKNEKKKIKSESMTSKYDNGMTEYWTRKTYWIYVSGRFVSMRQFEFQFYYFSVLFYYFFLSEIGEPFFFFQIKSRWIGWKISKRIKPLLGSKQNCARLAT